MKAECTFCRILAGNIPAPIVFEDEISTAFLDHRPLFPGHCLLIPKQHVETLENLPLDVVGPFFRNVQVLSKAVEEGMQAEGSFIAINNRVSQSVPHLHAHVVPRRKKDGLKGFFWPRHPYGSEAEMHAAQQAIQRALGAD